MFIRWRSHPASWHPGGVLSQAEIDAFAADGFVAVRGAVPGDVLRACQEEIWSELGGQGVRREDPCTWREPVVRIVCPESEAFAAAGTQPVLWEAFDQLMPFPQAARLAAQASAARPTALATGRAGDVFLCHPFLVHRATWPHRGVGPRMVAQPAVAIQEPFELRETAAVWPVERAILHALAR